MKHPKCMVAVHIYYPDLWGEIAHYIRGLHPAHYDLFVNVAAARTTAEWRDGLSRDFDRARVLVSPNLGQDVGGLLNVLGHADLAQYDLVCKVHTKKCEHMPEEGTRWRRDLLRACFENVDDVFATFRSNPNVTMVGSAGSMAIGNGINHRECLRLCDRLGIDRRLTASPWVAGCMFWCRPYIMQALKDAGLSQSEFPVPYGRDGTLAHAVERVFGALARSRGEIFWR